MTIRNDEHLFFFFSLVALDLFSHVLLWICFFSSHRSHELYLQSNCKMSFHYECSVIENSSSEIGKRETSDFRVFYFSLLKKLHVVCKCSETHSPNWSRLCICRTLFEFSFFFFLFFTIFLTSNILFLSIITRNKAQSSTNEWTPEKF